MKKISIVVPVWNEEANIFPLVKRIDSSLKKAKIGYEIIFIDDKSTDKSLKIFKKLCKKYPISFFTKQGAKGKSFSLIEGFKKASHDIIVMLDADLQYPPEAIVEMVSKITNGADIVVANRTQVNTSRLREYISKSFRYVFGKLLFGIHDDIQAGLKVFKKDVLKLLDVIPDSGWAFDLELLYKAKNAGFVIESVDIIFEKRLYGKSNISLLKTSWEIGVNALKVKMKPISPIHIRGKKNSSMQGAGIRFNGSTYITHSTLHYSQSAVQTFIFKQKAFFVLSVGILILGFIFKPTITLQIFVGILSFVYLADVLFNLFLVLKSLHTPKEITSSPEELAALNESDLPLYSILCPLYKEAHIIPQFLEAISKIDYPKKKLDVMLLLEEDDKGSILAVEKMNLPSYVRILVVPHSLPKTKPKACNYGLSFAKGEYLVIYDAEDSPDPLQLKKAYLGFKKTDKNIFCLQAKLNYYNPNQNLLTRFFTAEYSLWFDVTLPGLQAVNTSLPLGGTSNHFKTKNIQKLEGWDPFNVTEDADLGIRLFKMGYKTAIIDSVTLEEANSRWGNWLRQRSRWIKGYMQTYLVHTRDNAGLVKKTGIHALIFHLVIGGKIIFILVNPLLWLITLSYFTLHGIVGPIVDAAYPATVLYMAITSLVVGNFLFLFYYMIGCAKKGQWDLIKFVFLIPIYWIMISVAGSIALYQLIFKPHYWEKTVHGLHLKSLVPEIVVELEEKQSGIPFPTHFRVNLLRLIKKNNIYLSGGYLVIAGIVGNLLNFSFNIFFGRTQNFEDFGLLSLITNLLYLASIPLNALSSTVTYRSGFLDTRFGKETSYKFWSYIRKRGAIIGVISAFLWLAISPFLMNYFGADEFLPFLLFALIWVGGFIISIDKGYVSGKLLFFSLGLIILSEPIAKVLIAYAAVISHHISFAYMSVILPTFFIFITASYLSAKANKDISKEYIDNKEISYFPWKFFFASLLSGLSAMTFLSLDVILAKHFLSASEAGKYALISLVGKIIYFLGGLASQFVLPIVSRNEGEKKSSLSTLYYTLFATIVLIGCGFMVFGLFGSLSIPFLLGKKSTIIIPFLIPFSIAMMSFTLARVFVSYYLAKKIYAFAIFAFLLSILQFLLVSLHHENITAIVNVMQFTGILSLFIMIVGHLFINNLKSLEDNFIDFLLLFKKNSLNGDEDNNHKHKKRILIFNWRDNKHKSAGGAEVYIHELAKRWVENGSSVTIFCGNSRRNPKNEFVDGVHIYRRGGFYTVYIWAFLYYMIRFRGRFDVIIDSENGIPFFSPIYAREKKFLLIHHVHQEVFRKSLKWPFSSLASFMEAKLMPFVYRNCEVITVSPSSKKEILKYKLTKKQPHIIFNGVNLNEFTPGKKNLKPLILYVGRLQYYKSLHIFLYAAKQVLEEIPDATFVIAGEGEEEKNLKKLAEKLQINDKVHFLGFIPQDEKIDLYRKASVFVNPSFMEGWGLTVIEANACGTPTIASNVSGLQDSIQHMKTGILVDYGDINGFSKNIIQIITNVSLNKKMSFDANAWAKNFSWEKSASNFYQLLDTSQKASIINPRALVLNNYE